MRIIIICLGRRSIYAVMACFKPVIIVFFVRLLLAHWQAIACSMLEQQIQGQP